jgi:geranylgeranyl pyrophosphate synthase
MHVPSTSLSRLPEGVRDALSLASERISGFNESDFGDRVLSGPSFHILKRRGKFLRPTLVFLGAHAVDADPKEFVDLAVASELFHISSLIHDDIIDGDRERRGVPAVHVKYGDDSAILAGDALIAKAVELSSRYGIEVLTAMSHAAMDMCTGEALDSDYQKRRIVPSVSEYTRVARLKSASLIATCCNIAGIYVGKDTTARLHAFGENVGIAFQMRDDIVDFLNGDEARERTSRKGFRPNIVSSIRKEFGITGKEALKRAKEINNEHVVIAMENLDGMTNCSVLSEYSKTIMV